MSAKSRGIESLGFRTDLMLLALQGSEVEDFGDHLVVRSPRNPSFWWGNFLLLRRPPEPGSIPDWEQTFVREFPQADHRAIGVDGIHGAGADNVDLAAAGYAVDSSAVMTASSVDEPPHPNREATFRTLDLADPSDWGAAIALQVANGEESPGHLEFLTRRMDAMRGLQAAGNGAWFGAFVGGQMVSGMGLFSDGSGIARFQSVDTRPDSRGRGLAGTLVHVASTYGFTELGATTLVMVADPSYHAIAIYRSVGFTATETQVQFERGPSSAPTCPATRPGRSESLRPLTTRIPTSPS